MSHRATPPLPATASVPQSLPVRASGVRASATRSRLPALAPARAHVLFLVLARGLRGRAAAVLLAAMAAWLALLASAPALAQAVANATTVRYRVINLGQGEVAANPVINASGQVAFTTASQNRYLAGFFDGRRVHALGNTDWPVNFALALNDSGQVAGYSGTDLSRTRAFRWSLKAGLQALGSSSESSQARAINGAGDAAGDGAPLLSPLRAYRWSAANSTDELGTFNNGTTTAIGINDGGLIAGTSETASGSTHAFSWTRAGGIRDLGSLGGGESAPVALNNAGQMAGYAQVAGADGRYHAFLWTLGAGMRDLGSGKGIESFALAMARNGHIAGVINLADGAQHGMSWTAAGGMVDIGTLGGAASRALGVNGKGQVAGWAENPQRDMHAVIWSAAQGMVDLNGRLLNAPRGLLLTGASAIADDGAIVAESNAGLVLLRPLGQEVSGAPVVGPIEAPAVIRPGAPATVRVAFNDSDLADSHLVSWQWGDQTMEAAVVNEKSGSGTGSASGRHVYANAGWYTVTARVSDSAGNVTTVERELTVGDPDNAAAGRMTSPAGAVRSDISHSGAASLTLVAATAATSAAGAATAAGNLASVTNQSESLIAQPDPASKQAPGAGAQTPGTRSAVMGPQLRFATGKVRFISSSLQQDGATAGARRYSGEGLLNGKPGYQYSLSTSGPLRQAPGAGGDANDTNDAAVQPGDLAPTLGPLALRIWHRDPRTGKDIVDYANVR